MTPPRTEEIEFCRQGVTGTARLPSTADHTCCGFSGSHTFPVGPRSRGPHAEEAMAVPARAGHRLGDLRQAAIGLAVPGKTVLQHHHPLQRAVPFANQQRARFQIDAVLCRGLARREGAVNGFNAVATLGSPKHPKRRFVEIAKRCSLQTLGENPRQQPARRMGRRRTAQMIPPLQTKLTGGEIGEAGDEEVQRGSAVRRGRRRRRTSAGAVRGSPGHRQAAELIAARSDFARRAGFVVRSAGAGGGSIVWACAVSSAMH